MKVFYLAIVLSVLLTGCSRKWKQPTHCDFNLSFDTETSSGVNEINSSTFYVSTLSFEGVREEAGNIDISKTLDKQLNGNAIELIEFDIPQGTYTDLNTEIVLSRNSGAAHTARINGKHYFSGGSFNNFIIEIDSDILLLADNFDADGASTILLSKKVDRTANIELDVTALLDGIPEASWIDAVTGPGTIVIDSDSNQSLYLYVLMNISNYVDVRFL
ncbi:MAG: hypothetical protein P8M05_11740 [Flavobacteriales bacterium]|jgi:hypothetical protein|nr:hypothetical protein [Flavobacteriales bacterium]